jgi:TfoX/Sxy family transcriptional regulator of competence genes
MSNFNAHLLELLRAALEGTPKLTERRMFGSDGFFANGYAFAIVWDGRIVLKLADEVRAAELMRIKGASVFNPMGKGKGMTAWIVVPESFHDDTELLRKWTLAAHKAILGLPPKGIPKKKPTPKASRVKAPARTSSRTRG